VTLPTDLASVLYLGGVVLFGYRPDPIGWTLVAVACLLPEVDLPTSKVGRSPSCRASRPTARPVTGVGFSFCTYARARELEPWLDRVAVRGEVIGARYLAIGAGSTARYGFAGRLAAVVLSVRVFLVRGAGKAN
jgi:hypothetical protein